MRIETKEAEGYTIMRLRAARIDAAAAIQFKDAIRDETQGAQPVVVLDMQDVEFVDSSGLGAVVSTMKMLAPGHKLEVAALTPSVAKVFALTRMDRVFTIHAESPWPEEEHVG